MPRSMWEPWIVFRKPLEGRVQDNLRKWRTVIQATLSPTSFRGCHPLIADPEGGAGSGAASEPEAASVPPAIGQRGPAAREGIVLDPFCGAGSTLAAAEAVGYRSVGIESDSEYFDMACHGIPRLRNYQRSRPTCFRLCRPSALGAS